MPASCAAISEALHGRQCEAVDEAVVDVGLAIAWPVFEAAIGAPFAKAIVSVDVQMTSVGKPLTCVAFSKSGRDDDEQEERDDDRGRNVARIPERADDRPACEEVGRAAPPEEKLSCAALLTGLGGGGGLTSIALVEADHVPRREQGPGKSMRFPFTQVPFQRLEVVEDQRPVDDANGAVAAGDLRIGDDEIALAADHEVVGELHLLAGGQALPDREQRNAFFAASQASWTWRSAIQSFSIAVGSFSIRLRPAAAFRSSSSGSAGEARPRPRRRLGLLALGRLERTSRLRQEHVVERGLPGCEVGQGDARLVEGAHDVRNRPAAVTQADGDRAVLARCGDQLAEAAERMLQSLLVACEGERHLEASTRRSAPSVPRASPPRRSCRGR